MLAPFIPAFGWAINLLLAPGERDDSAWQQPLPDLLLGLLVFNAGLTAKRMRRLWRNAPAFSTLRVASSSQLGVTARS